MKKSFFALLPLLVAVFSCSIPNEELISTSPRWAVCYEKLDGDKSETWVNSLDQTPAVRKKAGMVELTYDKVGGKEISVKIVYSRSKDGKALLVTPSVRNNEANVFIKSFLGPVMSRDNDFDKTPLVYPRGAGLKIQAPPVPEGSEERPAKIDNIWSYEPAEDYYYMEYPYPSSGLTMQWMAFAGEEDGLYVACHDGEFSAKNFVVRYMCKTGRTDYAFRYLMACKTGDEYQCPSMLLQQYDGDWHAASRMYRSWYDTVRQIIPHPKWVVESSGWLLAILKQQNAEIMWPYNTLGKELSDVADERGLDIIGMFGWAHGGHDRFYPDYIPDPDMGGREGVIQGLKELHARGKRAIIYANGQLIDTEGTEYWGTTGKSVSIKDKFGGSPVENWTKYLDTPGRTHAKGCPNSEQWQEKLWELALQAHELGADGILFDQLGNHQPMLCYGDNHGHQSPAVVHIDDKFKALRAIRDRMYAIDPEFIIMTEGGMDPELNSISFFHSDAFGLLVPPLSGFQANARGNEFGSYCIFPEMLRFTFPEFLTTTRIPLPMNHTYWANMTALYGLRTEIESRYAADVKYLKEDWTPTADDYGNVAFHAGLEVHMMSTDRNFVKTYLRQVIDLCRKHKDILWSGTYNDNLGISYSSDNRSVIAKSFLSGNRMAVVVWNTDPELETAYSVDVPGYRLASIEAPEKEVRYGDKLSADRIHVLIYEKQ